MHSNESKSEKSTAPVSDRMLGNIVEQGFFVTPGSLAAARSACAELIFARAMIDAQTAAIKALNSKLSVDLKSAA